jgi:hypothetical protein
VLGSPLLDGPLFDRLREAFLAAESADELGPEAREWYDRFLVEAPSV